MIIEILANWPDANFRGRHNLKTVVDSIFVGKERQFNRRFLTLAKHYLFEPVACIPESDWEKGHSVRLTANQVRVVADGKVVAEQPRCFSRDQLIRDPWHYLPVLEKKPGAPFQQWDLPVSIRVVRDRILKQDKGDRAFVELLLMARSLGDSGLETLEVACDLTLQTGVIAAAIVLKELHLWGHGGRLARMAK